MTFRVFVTARSFADTDGAHQDCLRQHDCTLDLCAPVHPYSAEQLCDLTPGYDGVILGSDSFDASVIEQADILRVISRYGQDVTQLTWKPHPQGCSCHQHWSPTRNDIRKQVATLRQLPGNYQLKRRL